MLELNRLNEAQRKAATYGEGPLLVLAGPGSGKTFTITQRIFYLIIEKKIPPENILVITFTKEAAKSMQERFLLQSDLVYPVNFGTFHSVFYHILKESNAISNQKLLSYGQKRNLLISVLKKLNRQSYAGENMNDEALQILSVFGFYKNTNDEKASLAKLSPKWQPFFTQLFREYESARKREGAIDFDDMLYECMTLLKRDKTLRVYWQKRFTHILIDEFQDINPVQYEIVKLLLKHPYSLFAVGDDDQAIYGFRGSNPMCLRRFAEDFDAKKILLNINYRSYEEIVKASLLVIEENRERFSKCLEASDTHQGLSGVRITAFESRETQYDALTKALKLQQRKDESRAVLFRTNLLMQSFAVILKKAGIDYEMKEKSQSIYEHFIAGDILSYLQYATDKIPQDKTRRELLLRILNKPSRYISREALGEGEPDFKRMEAYYRECGHSCQRAEQSVLLKIREIKLLEKHMTYLRSASPKIAVQYIRKAVGYEQYLKEAAGQDKEKLQEWQEYLDWLVGDAAGYGALDTWLEAQKLYEKELAGRTEEAAKKSVEDGSRSIVQLMTVHASKGLEFDRVFLPDCNEKVFPHGSMPDTQACEEERRIFYVAMTRAKKNLELLCVTGTKERPRLPSRFLNPIWDKYITR